MTVGMPISASFEEAGDELFIFTAFPISQWNALRSKNALERINDEDQDPGVATQ
jgi:transposase-like protein